MKLWSGFNWLGSVSNDDEVGPVLNKASRHEDVLEEWNYSSTLS